MSHRQSCDRCRQQKVRCLRDESMGGVSNSASLIRASISPCERCMKAGVDCVYSLKQRTNRRSSQLSNRRNNSVDAAGLNSTVWLEQGQPGMMYLGGTSLGADLADIVGEFGGLDENGAVMSDFSGWNTTSLQSSFSPTPLNSLTTSSGSEVAPAFLTSSLTDDCDGGSDSDSAQHPTDALTTQLTSLGRRATRTMHRLARADHPPLTVSSPEVNSALEDTNKLIRIINHITTPDRGLDDDTTDYGLAFSALACHRQLIALFRAICDAIHRCLQDKRELPHRRSSCDGVHPSSVAQFVMVLQLLLHLINRMDRSLAPNLSPPRLTPDSMDLVRCDSASSASSAPSTPGLLGIAHGLIGTIPSEHEKLRLVIQKLQTETEFSAEL